MGDHRVSIKIEFEMHSHKDSWNVWWNWSDSIPQKMADWIEAQKEKAMDIYWEEVYELEKVKKAEEENHERDLLAELKAKYE